MSSMTGGLYRALLLAYPRSYRRRFARAMCHTFDDALADARQRGTGALAMTWLRALGHALRFGVAERIEAMAPRPMRPGRDDGRRPRSRGGDDIWRTTLQDVRYALRGFRRSPGFTVVAVLTLALGVGTTTAIFSVVNGVVLRPLPYDQPDRLVTLWGRDTETKNVLVGLREARSLAAVTGYSNVRLGLIGSGEAEELSGARVTPNHFSVLRVPPYLGRTFTDDEGTPGRDDVVILSYSLWQRRFGGDPSVLETRIQLGPTARTIVGVMPPDHRPMVRGWQFWIPITIDPTDFRDYSGTAGTLLLARLRPDVTLEAARAEVRAIAARLAEEAPEVYTEDWIAASAPMRLRETMVGDVQHALWILLGAVGLVLLIACVNIANLLLVRGRARRRELAIRAALGAARSRMTRQLFTESGLLGLIGGALGLGAGTLSVRLLAGALPASVPRTDAITVDGVVLVFALAVTVGASIGFGLLPALRSTRVDLQDSLKAASRNAWDGGRRHRLQHGLVVAEVALAVLLVVGAGLMIKSFWRLQHVDPGFNPENVSTMRLSPPATRYPEAEQVRRYFRRVHEELLAVPGVESVGAAAFLPMTGSSAATVYEVRGKPLPEGAPRRYANVQFVTPGYRTVMAVPLLSGRWLDETDRDGAPLVGVVNETMAREAWGDEDPIGATVQMFGSVDFTVIGVVGDVHQHAPDVVTRPEVYFAAEQVSMSSNLYLTIRTVDDPVASIAALKNAVWNVDHDVPISRVQTMQEVVSHTVADSRFLAILLGAFGLLALLLGTVGVYGVMSYVMGQRTHEIGIRIALGADTGRVLRGSMLQGMVPALLGVVLGVFGAVASTRLLSGLLFAVAPTDLSTFAFVPLLLVSVAAGAIYLPARRAANVDPMTSLNVE
jgi:putative ABC transport system permease protein